MLCVGTIWLEPPPYNSTGNILTGQNVIIASSVMESYVPVNRSCYIPTGRYATT